MLNAKSNDRRNFFAAVNYRSINDLNAGIVANLHRLPRDLDLIVGIPRSGLLAANLIALHLNLPLADLDGFIAGRILGGGQRLKTKQKSDRPFASLKALVVDDSITSGNALDQCRERLRAAGLDHNVLYLCAFVDAWAVSKVDIFLEVCPMPRVFEWNLFHHPMLENCCVDIDGVLCRDPIEAENDDGIAYEKFLTNVSPLIVPSVMIGALVTSRLEKYRALTEAWLANAGIKHQRLLMMQYPNQAARMRANRYAEYKAEAYVKLNAPLFIESSLRQAEGIVRLTGRPVFCTENRNLLTPATVTPIRQQARSILSKIFGAARARLR